MGGEAADQCLTGGRAPDWCLAGGRAPDQCLKAVGTAEVAAVAAVATAERWFAAADRQFAAADRQFATADRQFAAADRQFAAAARHRQFATVERFVDKGIIAWITFELDNKVSTRYDEFFFGLVFASAFDAFAFVLPIYCAVGPQREMKVVVRSM